MDYSIQAVARETGLSAHVLRVWEKRYSAVVPRRTETNRRVYSEADVQRLQLLRRATQLGHPISHVAKLTPAQLETVAQKTPATPSAKKKARTPAPSDASLLSSISECVAAVRAFDLETLNRALHRATVERGFNGLLRHVIAPLAQEIGDLWSAGLLTVAHEHFATAAIRTFLLNPARQYAGATSNATVVVATPQGQLHELGSVMAASLAGEQGWHAIYLGPSLPAAEIAGVALQNSARAVVLSIIYPDDDPNLVRELHDLRHLLPNSVNILVCGRAAESYRSDIAAISAVIVQDLAQLQAELAKIRARRS